MTEPKIRITVEIQIADGAEALSHQRAKRIADSMRTALDDAFSGARIAGLWVHSIPWQDPDL